MANRVIIPCPDCGLERFIIDIPRNHRRRCSSCGKRAVGHRPPVMKTHGDSYAPLYAIWKGMKMRARVHGPLRQVHRNHAARGIHVCTEWLDYEAFKAWALSAGYVEGLEIDRRNNDLGYSPDNCRWVSRSQNLRNTRRNRLLSAFGRTQCLIAWAEEFGLGKGTLASRLRAGWPIEKALMEPAGEKKPEHLVTAFGKTQCLTAWSRQTGLRSGTIWCRLQLGWPPEEALTVPALQGGKKIHRRRSRAIAQPHEEAGPRHGSGRS